MTKTEAKLARKALAGLIISEELEKRIKGTIHVGWLGDDCRISVSRKGIECYALTYEGFGKFVSSKYCLSSDLDLIVDDVIKDFTQSIYETFFK